MLYLNACNIDSLLKDLTNVICLASAACVTKTMSKQRLFCFNTAFVSNAWQDRILFGIQFVTKTCTCNLHCCRWHKFSNLVQHSIFLYSWQLHVTQQQYAQNGLLCFRCEMITPAGNNVTRYVHCLSCFENSHNLSRLQGGYWLNDGLLLGCCIVWFSGTVDQLSPSWGWLNSFIWTLMWHRERNVSVTYRGLRVFDLTRYSKTCLKRNAIVPVFFSVFTVFRFTKGCVLIKQSTKNMIA